jgi:hypothetical protein
MGDKSPRNNAKSKKQKTDKKQAVIASKVPVVEAKPITKTR